jgi:hypothetical protein
MTNASGFAADRPLPSKIRWHASPRVESAQSMYQRRVGRTTIPPASNAATHSASALTPT